MQLGDEIITVNTEFGRYLTTRAERYRFGIQTLGEAEAEAREAAYAGATGSGICVAARSTLTAADLARRLSAAERQQIRQRAAA